MSSTAPVRPPESTSASPAAPPRKPILSIVFVFLLLLVAAYSIYTRLQQRHAVAAEARETSTPVKTVHVAEVSFDAKDATLTLPGNTEGAETASISARVPGYLRARYVDIGTRVKAGQLLAIVDSPETDQDLAQGRANLAQAQAAYQQAQAAQAQAEANRAIAQLSRERYVALAKREVVSRQEGDEREYAYNARVADVNAAAASVSAALATVRAREADVRRLEQTRAFERVLAPFNGVVTTRNIDQGDLINAGAPAERPMFTVARTDVLRVQVAVPQSASGDVRLQQTATVTSPGLPGRSFTGRVARTAQAITQNSRTLMTELQIDNRDGALLPGMFVNAQFQLKRSQPVAVLSSEALIINTDGTKVAVVDGDHAVLTPVQLGRDFGKTVEIRAGLQAGQRVILSPTADIVTGTQVRVLAQGNAQPAAEQP